MTSTKDQTPDPFSYLKGDGEMARLIRSTDWTATVLGHPLSWPQSLKTTLGIMISSRFPMFLFWGPELICFYNDGYRHILGQSGKHPGILGKPGKEAWADTWEGTGARIQHVLSGEGATWSQDQLIPIYRNGRIEDVYWTFSHSPVLDPSGNIEGVFVVCTETTEKVKLLEDLRETNLQLNAALEADIQARIKIEESEERFRTMAEGSDIMIAVGDETSNAVYFNKAWTNLTGRSMNELLQFGWADLIHPEDKEPYVAGYIDAFNKKDPYVGELRIRTQNDEYRWLLSKAVPRFRPDGSLAGYISSCMDITDRKESERLAEINAGKLQAINEEMAAANEELTSTNEELAAVNEELAAANEELLQTHSNLQDTMRDFEESEHRIREMVSSAPFPIGVYTGREMRITLVNKSIMDVWGKGYDVAGKTYAEVLPELAGTGIYEQLDAVFTTGKAFHARGQRVDLVFNGVLQPFYFNYSFTPLYDTSGKVYGVMNTAAEVTDLYMAKQKIEQSERNLYNMILQAPVAMCIMLGPDHVVDVANEKIIELWGKPVEAVMGKPIFEGLPDAREQGLEALLAGVYHTGVAFEANERPVVLLRNGREETVYQNFVYQPYRDASGNILGVLAITIDVTEQVVARQKIEQSEAELLDIKKKLEAELEAGKQIQRQKDAFIGIASHELKTPLTSLTAILQVTGAKVKNNEDPFLAGAMDKANVQVKRMSGMINSFLNVSRLEAGKIIIEKQEFRLDELLHEVVSELQPTAPDHDIRLNDCPVTVLADREKIGSVISNLLSNAVKYSLKGTVIELNCYKENDQVKISIKDQGIGVPAQDLERLFERYYRVESSNTMHISGFGIGLYLSAEIVKQHGGRIWAESEPGNGSTFYFTIPLNLS